MKKTLKSWSIACMCITALAVCVFLPIHGLQQATAEITAATVSVAAQLVTDQGGWQVLGTFLAAGDEATDFTVTQRKHSVAAYAITVGATGHSKIVIYGPLNAGANCLRLRMVGVTDAESNVIEFYAGACGNNDDWMYVKRGTLTWTIGTQLSATGALLLADTVVVTNDEASSSSWTAASPANNTCAEVMIDLQGDDTIMMVPTTLGGNAKLLGKFY